MPYIRAVLWKMCALCIKSIAITRKWITKNCDSTNTTTDTILSAHKPLTTAEQIDFNLFTTFILDVIESKSVWTRTRFDGAGAGAGSWLATTYVNAVIVASIVNSIHWIHIYNVYCIQYTENRAKNANHLLRMEPYIAWIEALRTPGVWRRIISNWYAKACPYWTLNSIQMKYVRYTGVERPYDKFMNIV